jgi:hypothetical protein
MTIVWRKRRGSVRIVHAYEANSCVDVPICGACMSSGLGFVEYPPSALGFVRQCRRCSAIAGRRE